MRILITLLAFTGLILFSRQKERDFANQSSGGSGTVASDGLLIKTVA